MRQRTYDSARPQRPGVRAALAALSVTSAPILSTLADADAVLKPEMFASVTQFSDSDLSEVHIPDVARNAVIYEGDATRLWVAHNDRSIELRRSRPVYTMEKGRHPARQLSLFQ
jgi:hypothetical protein